MEMFQRQATWLTLTASEIALHWEGKGRHSVIEGCQFCMKTFRKLTSGFNTRTILLTTQSKEELIRYYDSFGNMRPEQKTAYADIYDFLAAEEYDDIKYLQVK
jgi:hypothetical protein